MGDPVGDAARHEELLWQPVALRIGTQAVVFYQ